MSKHLGKILTLFVSSEEKKCRIEKDYFHVDKKGIIEDKYYNKDIKRSILITSLESYKLINSYKISMEHGALGENLLIEGNPYELTPGTQLKVGSAILEISQYCTICSHLAHIDPRVPELLKKDRGIFVKVIREGKITRNDPIVILS